jgi:hypothetical protein
MDPRQICIEIQGSPAKLFGLAALGIIMTGLSAAIAFGMIPPGDGSFVQFLGGFGVLFFGTGLVIALYRLATSSGTLITLSPEGLHDVRVSQRPVPWDAISDVSVWSAHGQDIIVVAMPPEIEQRIGLTRMARWSRGANAKLGADGLCIASTGLNMKHVELLAAISERVAFARI